MVTWFFEFQNFWIVATKLLSTLKLTEGKCSLNPIPLDWMPFWHSLPFSLYLKHGFSSESENIRGVGKTLYAHFSSQPMRTAAPKGCLQKTANFVIILFVFELWLGLQKLPNWKFLWSVMSNPTKYCVFKLI